MIRVLTILAIGLSTGFAQRQQAQQCYSPDNYSGYCTTLSNCQYVALLYEQNGGSNQVRQYLFGLRRACGNVVVQGDPVVCCTQGYNTGTTQTTTARQPRPPSFAPITKPTTTTTTDDSNRITRQNACRTPDRRSGSCISLRDCPVLLRQLETNPYDTSFAQYLRDSNLICRLPTPIVCCPTGNSGQITATTPRAPVTKAPSFTPVTVSNRLPRPDEGCGLASQSFKKVVGGQPAKPGDWPWIALIGYTDSLGQNAFKCGGALITSKHVLTAAHCLRSDLKFVRLGENDLRQETETQYMDIPVEKSFRHPKYDRTDGHSDLAVLRLSKNAPYTDFIRFACLPSDPQLRSKSYVNLNPFVAGWGKTQEGGKSAEVLQEIQVPIHSNNVCIERYAAEGRYVSEKQFDKAVLCAGVLAGGMDTCQGDSGGPLVQPELYRVDNKHHYYVIGVVSYGIGCARPNIPGIYTNVPNFVDWVEQQVKDTSP